MKRTKRKYIIYFSFVSILIIGVLWVDKKINRILTTDLKYNTRYSENYKERKFKNLSVGLSKSELGKLLGEPIEIIKPEFEHSIIYSKHKVEIKPGSWGVSNIDTIHPIAFCRINFLRDGSVKNSFNAQNYIDSTYLIKIEKLSYNEIIDELGKPLQEYKCDCNCEIYNYSRLKEGAHSGKIPLINIKRVAIGADNKIKYIVDEVGNPYSKQIGVCEI